MAIEFIPNQPVKFTDDTQDGLNNDNKAWDILLQNDDSLCVQMKMTPCGENLLPTLGCTTDVNKWSSDLSTDSDWVLGDGWVVTGGQATHSGSTQGLLEGITNTLDVGKIYKVTFDIVSINDFLSVYLGTPDPLFSYYLTTAGTYTLFFTYSSGDYGLFFDSNNDTVIANLSICLYSEVFGTATGWSFSDVNDSFCHGVGSTDPILTASDYFQVDSYYQIKIKVYNRSAGSIFVKSSFDGMDSFGSTETVSSNGDFTLYLQNDSVSAGKICITPSSDFDGCISNIEVYDLTPIQTGNFVIVDNTGTSVSNSYDITSTINPIICYKDRLSWCVSFDSVTYLSGQIALNSGCYYIVFSEYCGEGSITEQVNRINYSAEGFRKTKYLSGTCVGEAFGFEFTNSLFQLGQRVPIFQINPKYPTDGDEYALPTGTKRKAYIKSEKTKILWVDFIDENAHDTLRLQVNCDVFTIDGEEYYLPINDYDPIWETNGKSNTAQVQIEIQKKVNTLFNR